MGPKLFMGGSVSLNLAQVLAVGTAATQPQSTLLWQGNDEPPIRHCLGMGMGPRDAHGSQKGLSLSPLSLICLFR